MRPSRVCQVRLASKTKPRTLSDMKVEGIFTEPHIVFGVRSQHHQVMRVDKAYTEWHISR